MNRADPAEAIERMFCRFKDFRRIAIRCDGLEQIKWLRGPATDFICSWRLPAYRLQIGKPRLLHRPDPSFKGYPSRKTLIQIGLRNREQVIPVELIARRSTGPVANFRGRTG
jgi:hypothetical protein